MQQRLEVGSYVFIIESNRIITEAVAAVSIFLHTIIFSDGGVDAYE